MSESDIAFWNQNILIMESKKKLMMKYQEVKIELLEHLKESTQLSQTTKNPLIKKDAEILIEEFNQGLIWCDERILFLNAYFSHN